MAVFNFIVTVLFLAWLFLTAYIGYRILSGMQEQTTTLTAVLMDTVVRTADAAKLSSEDMHRVVALLEQRQSHEHQ